jgi:glycosyltransferase involved in cell wall biosynthesis
MENAKVSVIIPVYNVEKYLNKCLESIINQTLTELEIICVNDGSTDTSHQILEEYALKDERIKIINKENNGPGAARNTGIEVATGEYIGFVDSDDWIELDAYEKLYKNAKSQNSDIVMCPTHMFDETTKELKYDQPYFTLEYFDKYFDNAIFNYNDTKDFLFRIIVTAWNKIYKTEFLNKINARFPENLIFEDNPFFYETYLKTSNVSLIRDYLYYYRVNRNDSIISKADKKFLDLIKIFENVQKIFIETNNIDEYKYDLIDHIIGSIFGLFSQLDEIYKQEFFENIKQYFMSFDLQNDEFNKLTCSKNIYQDVMNSNSYKEYGRVRDKQIFSISMVKNEMDIIESFVRYNANIFDGMIILDNCSTDDTVKILKLLKNEGLPLFIFEDEEQEFQQFIKRNQLLLKAVNEFKADIVVPLDADEFIICTNKGNPRKILEKMGSNIYGLVKWKTYVPDFNKNNNKQFIPDKITLVRDEDLERFYKVIIPKELVIDYDARLATGSHNLIFDHKYENLIEHVICPSLRIAHFPIRSKEQLFSKIVVGWINELQWLDRQEGDSSHWQIIFNKIKENEVVEDEEVVTFAKEYALFYDSPQVNMHEDPIDLTFCNDIDIKYSNKKIKPIANLLETCEWLSISHLNLKKEKIKEEQQLKIQIENLSSEMNELYARRMKAENILKSEIEAYKNSTSWTVTAPLRKFVSLIKKTLK